MYKASGSRGAAPIGEDLIKMLESMTHRGKDSSGVTVAGQQLDEDLIIRIWTGDAARAHDILASSEETVRRAGGEIRSNDARGEFLRLTVNYEGEISALAEALLNTEGV